MELKLIYFVIFECFLIFQSSNSFEFPALQYQLIKSCKANQSFDGSTLQCFNCPQNAVPTSDGLGCRCVQGSIVRLDTSSRTGPAILQCELCPKGQTSTRDHRSCIKCPENGSAGKCNCPPIHILIEREENGQLLEQARCVQCDAGSEPSRDQSQCLPCKQMPSLTPADFTDSSGCNCSTIGSGYCLPANLGMDDRYIPSGRDSVVKFDAVSGETSERWEFESAFFKEHVKPAAYYCYKHRNSTACQLLGNLCAMTLHDKEHPVCALVFSLALRDRLDSAPHLFFSESQTNSILKEEDITNVYNVRDGTGASTRSRLNITTAVYSLDGRLLRLEPAASGALFQLCNGTFGSFDAAFNFATRYKKKCKVAARELFEREQESTQFFNIYVPYEIKAGTSSSESRLFAIPMLVLNRPNNKDEYENRWSLTTRFFLVDPVSGIAAATNEAEKPSKMPEVVRFLKKMEIRITMLNTREFPEKAGRIYPPLAVIEYGQATLDDLKSGKEFDFEFSINYEMEMKESKKDIEIAIGVLSAFAVLWSAMETWSWSRRSGKLAIDPFTLGKLLLNVCGNLAHVFLVVIFFTSLYWFAFFKQQNFLHVLLPSEKQENLIKSYVISIFALKIIDVMHLLFCQMSADIFLIDWERPRPASTTYTKSGKETNQTPTSEVAVSVWRTYLVANEWNELQTRRKINPALQAVLVILILKICGVENLATADPENSFKLDDGKYHSEFSYVCRFALGVAIYAAVSLGQVIFWCGIYSRLVEDKLEQFTDVCSLANISVFAMAHKNFGYYIHGKSAHGFSDTDMATLLEQLQRESDDLCGHRGLQPGSDHQTFSMALPLKLRNYYDKVVTPVTGMAGQLTVMGGRHRGGSSLTGTNVQHMVQSYVTMNRFLSRFLEHALRDLDFEVRDKMIVESILDIEFQDPTISDKAIFYTDRGHSFDALLLYGHEFSLTIFDLMVFSFVDLFTQDFLAAAITTFFVAKFVVLIRQIGGRRNLARKTLIDKRFLI